MFNEFVLTKSLWQGCLYLPDTVQDIHLICPTIIEKIIEGMGLRLDRGVLCTIICRWSNSQYPEKEVQHMTTKIKESIKMGINN